MKGVLHKCTCCGFSTEQGVLVEGNSGGYITFVCERCFRDPNLFFSAKRILPHWTLAVKTQVVHNPFAKGYATSRENQGGTTIEGFLTKKAKRELATSESLYKGQKTLA